MKTKISNKQLAENMKKFLGKRVGMIKGKHEGQAGVTSRVYERKNMKPIMMVKLDSGIEIETRHDEVMYLVMENNIRVGDFPEHFNNPPEIQDRIDLAKEIMKDIEKYTSENN